MWDFHLVKSMASATLTFALSKVVAAQVYAAAATKRHRRRRRRSRLLTPSRALKMSLAQSAMLLAWNLFVRQLTCWGTRTFKEAVDVDCPRGVHPNTRHWQTPLRVAGYRASASSQYRTTHRR